MVASKLEQLLFEELGYAGTPGLLTEAEAIPWPNGRPIPHIQAALFLEHQPLAYFSRFSELDLDEIRQLHKNVWSQSKAPLLFVTLPHEIRVYSGYDAPPGPDKEPKLLQHLTELADHLSAQQKIRQELIDAYYHRIYLETGAFWDSSEARKIDYQARADRKLVASMKQVRQFLTNNGLTNHLAYTLLGRSIFICYLEDRGILDMEWIQQMTQGEANSYREALGNGRSTTYVLYEQLSNRFNGDLFPVEDAEKDVEDHHLKILLDFLNQTDLKTGQLSFWPYNFEYIPIELISHIYDAFIGESEQRSASAYYTPLPLVDFMLEETMGDEVIQPDMAVLDPACGSGIFLVGAYRRLIQAWARQNGQLNATALIQILRQNIYGVDKNEEAVRIAAFSLYLEILNHLTNEQVREDSFRFPPLQSQNLLGADFFTAEIDAQFAQRRFDRIVGNMPWGKGTLTSPAQQWLKEHNYTVGGKQAAPAFMLRVPGFCSETGEIALLSPVKSTILVTSDTHKTFRDQFFRTYHVRAVVNFAAIVYELFPKAISPAAAVFYTPNEPDFTQKLVYGVPKPSPLSQHLKAIVLDTTDIKFLDHQHLLDFPHLWKIAQWGTPRDAALIERLNDITTLSEQSQLLNWSEPREGFQVGKSKDESRNQKRKPTPDHLKDVPFLPTTQFEPYFVSTDNLSPTKERFLYLVGEKERYKGPLVLIHQSNCQAAFVDTDISYLASFSGINGKKGQEPILKWLVCLINSPLTKYYQFLTSTRWAVERRNPLHKEYKDMPFLIPHEDDERLQEILHYLEQMKTSSNEDDLFLLQDNHRQQEYETIINKLVYELYRLHPVEQQLVDDMLNYGMAFFEWAKKKTRKPNGIRAVRNPDVPMLTAYADVFSRTATSLFHLKNKTLNAIVYKNRAPLTVVSFDLVDLDEAQPTQVVTQSDAMHAKLYELDKLLLEQKAPSMYMRQHVRVYDGEQMSLVRPSEQRFWTQSQARADADAFLAEVSLF
ncbi:MAG: N-6 DNA methylase [Chloroflexi bacterium]|nr:N-6 DNA methylase [Chloroflexota bacterium]